MARISWLQISLSWNSGLWAEQHQAKYYHSFGPLIFLSNSGMLTDKESFFINNNDLCLMSQLWSHLEADPYFIALLSWAAAIPPGLAFTVAELGDMNNGPAPAACWWCHHQPGGTDVKHRHKPWLAQLLSALELLSCQTNGQCCLLPDCAVDTGPITGDRRTFQGAGINQVNQTTSLTPVTEKV